MKAKRKGLILIVTLLLTILSTCTVFAKDVSDDSNSPKSISVNKMYTETFEKKGDWDCFSFVSGGGSYKLQVYDLSGREVEELGEIMDYGDGDTVFLSSGTAGITVSYGQYDYFSAVAGDPPSLQLGSYMTSFFSPTKEDGEYQLVETISLGSFKKGKTVGVIIKGDYKGKYKFKVTGKDASDSSKKTLKSSNTTISVAKSVVYSGEKLTPSVTVKYNGKKLKKGTDYSVSYSNNKNPGKATVKIVGKGNYKGTVKTTFKIKKAKIYVLCYGSENAAKRDVSLMKNVFSRIKIPGYELKTSNIKSYTYSGFKKSQFNKAIKNTFSKTTSKDMSFIYFIGHGRKGSGIATGADEKDYYGWLDILNYIGKNVKGKIVFLPEACFSGGFVSAAPKCNASDRITVFSAASSGAPSNNTHRISNSELLDKAGAVIHYFMGDASLGCFTAAAAKGLGYPSNKLTAGVIEAVKKLNPPSDSNKDGKVTVNELYKYIKKDSQVKATGQSPKLYAPDKSLVIFGE